MTEDELFKSELCSLLNRCSQESRSNTPDFILANYLIDCLRAWDLAVTQHDHYGMLCEPLGIRAPHQRAWDD